MRNLWNILAFLAVVNLLALAFGVGWLWYSGRLDETRVHAVRELFRMPVAEVEAMRFEMEQEQVARETADLEKRRWGQVPATSVSGVDAAERWRDLERTMQDRLESQADALADGIDAELARRIAELDRRAQLLAEGEAAIEARMKMAQDEDFKTLVSSISDLDEDDALAILLNWVEQGDEPLVVSVMASLDADQRADLITELVKQEQAELASRLLLELRKRGWVATSDAEKLNATDPSASRKPGRPVLAGGANGLDGES
ncbi:MAG: hypothetical protein MK085_12000 [Phycisphaerales bacterium]|nr:hypothetical protein [Phycisphaerales bacterium]